MNTYTSNSNSIQSYNSYDRLKFKNQKGIKYVKKIVVKNSESKANKNKLFYRCDDRPCDNTFIDWCKSINKIELIMRVSTNVNDIELILDKVKRMKDELHWVWIKNHNIKASIANIKLIVVANLVHAMLIFVTIIMLMSSKLY
jgi:hypothetical protein